MDALLTNTGRVRSTAVPALGRVVIFGTYDERRHPRVRVLREGLTALGYPVDVVNVPLDLDTAARVKLLSRPWRGALVALRLALAWARLIVRSRRAKAPATVIVGYLGALDIHLARLRWPRAHLVLDQMVSLAETLADRGLDASPIVTRLLTRIDRAATGRADTVLVDTTQQAAELPPEHRERAMVVRVGAPEAWFEAGSRSRWRTNDGESDLSVVFFGLYTPLQGSTTIGEAIAKLRDEPVSWTMIGIGQDRSACEEAAAPNPRVRWVDWIDADDLPGVVTEHDVCLGIFGTGAKALRVVPNKVYQGAAAGCAIVTSDSPAQRSMLGDAAVFTPSGDAEALARAIVDLAADRSELARRKRSAQDLATRAFAPRVVVAGLARDLRGVHDGAMHRGASGQPPLAPNAALRWHVVRDHIEALGARSILECGTGQGSVGSRLSARHDYVGIEPDEVSRSTAATVVAEGSRLVDDIDELEDGETFDLVCAFEVLEHIEDDKGVLSHWVEHVRAGGHVLVSVPADPERFAPFDELAGHLRRYTPDGLRAVFEAAGLSTVSVEHYGYPLGIVLEAGRNAIARRRLAADRGPADLAARTAGSGRHLQPPAWSGHAIWWATSPFRHLQRRYPDRGPGLVGLARKPG
jgi:glycosyltransferase involved in cell wall biosynthesis